MQVYPLYGDKKFELPIGEGRHGTVSWRLLLPQEVVKTEKFSNGNTWAETQPPWVGWAITPGPKGWLVLQEGEGWVTTLYDVYPGYRGTGSLELLEPAELEHFYKYPLFRSPVGSLGKGEGVIFSVPIGTEVIFRWEREGRLYGAPTKGIDVVRDGQIVLSIPNVRTLEELAVFRT